MILVTAKRTQKVEPFSLRGAVDGLGAEPGVDGQAGESPCEADFRGEGRGGWAAETP